MKIRLRAVAALLALSALTLSFAEGVWASTCMPGMEMETDSASMDAAPDAAASEMDMAAPMEESGNRPPESPAAPNCPFVPAGTAGACAVAVSLPAASQLDLASSSEGALLAISPDPTRGLLLASAFFRPPRA